MLRLSVALAACALFAGCSDPAPTPANTAAAATGGTAAMEAKIAALSPALQQTTLFRAIQDANYDCQRIVNMVSRGKPDGKPMWAVECDGGRQYLIELQPGDIFHVSGVPKATGR